MTRRDLLTFLRLAPPSTLVPAADVLAALEQEVQDVPAPAAADASTAAPTSWRERIWTAHPEVRLGVTEVAEALGKPRSFVYRRTGPAAESAGMSVLPCRRLDGELVFTVGELRDWIRRHEVLVHAPAVPVTPLRRAS